MTLGELIEKTAVYGESIGQKYWEANLQDAGPGPHPTPMVERLREELAERTDGEPMPTEWLLAFKALPGNAGTLLGVHGGELDKIE